MIRPAISAADERPVCEDCGEAWADEPHELCRDCLERRNELQMEANMRAKAIADLRNCNSVADLSEWIERHLFRP